MFGQPLSHTSQVNIHQQCLSSATFSEMKVPTATAAQDMHLLGEPSGVVKKPRRNKKFEIHFNRQLAPGGSKAVTPVCKKYIPDVNGEFYSQILIAIKKGIKFVLCIIDIDVRGNDFYIPRIPKLIRFCNDNSIPVVNFNEEGAAAIGLTTSDLITHWFTTDTKTIIKPTYSIFSTPETHEYLKEKSPDALIL